ncbi:forkhead box protein P3-like [Phyllobates terribilis]|uniref:forkhead box protein P3-like n=1 Tax=Phyllobates terribilis TaxID=111132 RepID=UPI003CCB346E
MPSSQDKTVQTSSPENDGTEKEQNSQWSRRNGAAGSQLHQHHQSPYIMVSPPASSYLRALLHENKQAVVIHPITRDTASQSPVLHLASSITPSLPSSSSSSSSSSVPNLQSSRYFQVINKPKQVHPVPPGFNLAGLGWAQHESGFGKGEEDSISKKSTVSAYVQELSSNTERFQKKSFNDGPNKDSFNVEECTIHPMESSDLINPFQYGCACKKTFTDRQQLFRHLHNDHNLEEKGKMQWFIQMEVVRSLEEQLAAEKQKLHEMQSLMMEKLGAVHMSKPRECGLILQPSHHSGVSPWPGLNLPVQLHKEFSHRLLALRRKMMEGNSYKIHENVTACMEYYKTNNVRPPFTYACLIRWAIMESPQKQLALNEIYHWFTKMFAFFRFNKVTWKNAVRHNLSLHKCFVRVENIKGAVWMVDEMEFQRKRGGHGGS